MISNDSIEIKVPTPVALCFPAFIALKLVTVYGATWSWWWLLMPVVPVFGCILHSMAGKF